MKKKSNKVYQGEEAQVGKIKLVQRNNLQESQNVLVFLKFWRKKHWLRNCKINLLKKICKIVRGVLLRKVIVYQ
jgi:hypothetical protein